LLSGLIVGGLRDQLLRFGRAVHRCAVIALRERCRRRVEQALRGSNFANVRFRAERRAQRVHRDFDFGDVRCGVGARCEAAQLDFRAGDFALRFLQHFHLNDLVGAQLAHLGIAARDVLPQPFDLARLLRARRAQRLRDR
jgi:hypothetical protein